MALEFAGGFTLDSVEFQPEPEAEPVRPEFKGQGRGKGKSKIMHITHAEFEREFWEFGKGGGKCGLGHDDDYMYMWEEVAAMARKGQVRKGQGRKGYGIIFCDDDDDDYEMYIGKGKGLAPKSMAMGKGSRSRSPRRLSHGLPASGSDEVNDETEMLRSTMGKGTEKGKGGGGRSSCFRRVLSRLFRRA